MQKILNNLNIRLDQNIDNDSYQYYNKNDYPSLKRMQSRLNIRGGTQQDVRMREDKLKSLKKALLYSYQSAVVQKYNVENENNIIRLTNIINFLQNNEELEEQNLSFLKEIQKEYFFLYKNRYSLNYINHLKDIKKRLSLKQPCFRCLINHDKLKVAYQDKIISIPFELPPIGSYDPVETDFHNGTVFKWVHGNKEEWTPDTYWIVYMQYSEETAYFRAEIRKADEQIQIITIDDQGNETSTIYRGWMTGPDETEIVWNVKKGVVWNDMNYTKKLYITKDENTQAFFKRFDRVKINGKPWEIQAYNDNYSISKTDKGETGIIRVALKETYTNTDQFVAETLENAAAQVKEAEGLEPYIDGPTTASPYDIIKFKAYNFNEQQEWTISNNSIARIIKYNEDNTQIQVEILTGRSNAGFTVNYGSDEQTRIDVKIKSLV